MFHGWRVVAACFVIAAVAWGLGTFGASVYLQAVTAAHGWPIADVAFAITLFYLVSALVQRLVGRGIDRWGPRPVLLLGTASMALGVAGIGQVAARWQLYPCFVLIGLGWAALSTTGIAATVAPWFERHQGRSMTLAIMGASVGAILGVPVLLLAIGHLGIERGLAVVGAGAAAILLPLIARVLRFRRPEEIGQRRDGDATLAEAAPTTVVPPIAMRAKRPLLLWSAAAAFALGLAMQIGHITTLGPIVVRREFGAAAFGATYGTAASVIQLTSAFGPAAIGVLRDSFGGYRPGLAIASAVTLAACTILFAGGRLATRS